MNRASERQTPADFVDGEGRPEQIAWSDLQRQARRRLTAPKGRGPGWGRVTASAQG